MKNVNFKNKWVLAVLALFGVSLISAGVFASAAITLNSNGTVNLGAGAVGVSVCDQQATISTQQTYNSTFQRFELTTISLAGIDYDLCDGKVITMALKDGSNPVQSTTWAIDGTTNANTSPLVWGGSAGTGLIGSVGLTAINTAASNISTIAISAQ